MNKVAPKNPTLGDVAALANVSTATISRFLNSPDVVAPETAKRIARAIAVTGYIPNMLAGGLASKRSKMVAVLIPHLAHSIFNDMIETMAEELARGGTTVMMALTGGEEDRTEAMIQTAIGRRVDAIISTAPVSEETMNMLRRFPGLFIQIWDLPERPVGLAVGFSHRAVGREVARFLSARGYRHPLLVTTGSARAGMRCDGFVEAWQALGGGVVQRLEVSAPSRFGHARRVFADMRHLPRQPDVVLCGSDFLAQGIIIEAQAAGLRVPDQLAVMGFGNASIAGDMRPTITSVDIDGAAIAREALAAIAAHGEGRLPLDCAVDVGFRVIARESA
jgi:LacI family transcriptional regulator, gluconate utilization system Gnt-I transcriptional repressor